MQKRLRPTLREKKRYLLARGSRESIEKAILEFIGVLGYAKSGIKFVKVKEGKLKQLKLKPGESGKSVFAVNREKLNEIRASLMFKNINILRVSGTLKGLEKKRYR